MKATLKADQMDEIFSKTQNLISEALLKFTENGLEITAADPAMVGMIHLEIPEDSFKEYEINPESELYEDLNQDRADEDGMYVGLNLENLASVVNLFDEEITLTIEENNVILKEEEDRFQLPILNLSTDDIPEMDTLDFITGGEFSNEDFKTMRKKLAIASDTAELTLNRDGKLTVEGEGGQISVETSFELDDPEIYDEEFEDEEATSLFALSYLKKAQQMFNNLDSCDEVKLEMGEDFPLKLTHESNRENLEFVLAPRIEEA